MIGLILAGGKSSRLGYDKTTVVHQGQTLLERSATLLGRHCHPVYISCRNPENVPLQFPLVIDQTDRIGPAGGIMTALRTLGGPVFALACDLPFLEDRFLSRLLEARQNRPAHCVMTTWLQQKTGFIESLVAIYEQEALPLLEKGVTEKVFKLSSLIPPSLRHCLSYDDTEADFFFNINFPQDVKRLRPETTRVTD